MRWRSESLQGPLDVYECACQRTTFNISYRAGRYRASLLAHRIPCVFDPVGVRSVPKKQPTTQKKAVTTNTVASTCLLSLSLCLSRPKQVSYIKETQHVYNSRGQEYRETQNVKRINQSTEQWA